MKLQWIIGLYLLHTGLGQLMEPGSCSQKCQDALEQQDNATVEENTVSVSQTYCSCMPSCKVYKDCCYDSPFISEERSAPVPMICISVANQARYKAIASCANNWNQSSYFCRGNIGHLPPVTSQSTGITYANTNCAVCNYDADQLVIWKVDLKCGSEHDDITDYSRRRFIYRNGSLTSFIVRRNDIKPRRCSCKYFALDENDSFADTLELRVCEDSNLEISECSSTWTNETFKNLCDSFFEPVYIGDQVYRNAFCAQCNNVRLNPLSCKQPVISNRIFLEEANQIDMYNYCDKNNFRECKNYVNIFGKGKRYGINKLMQMKLNECIPEKDKVCCKGERLDTISKTCKKSH